MMTLAPDLLCAVDFSLGEADHPQDAEYVAGIILAWSSAYI
ncbi:hypothetical protein JEM67_17245 [Serratia sp. PAMC26656]|nr:hypothetical protein [Serratia sp. PAMC26656]